MSSIKSKDVKTKSSWLWTFFKTSFILVSSVPVIFLSYCAARTLKAGDPLTYMIPNTLLYTPYYKYATPIWKYLDPPRRLPLKNEQKIIRTIHVEDYDFAKFKELTEDFRYPGVIKGLFKNTTAVEKWTEKGYLSETIGEFDVKVRVRINDTSEFNNTMATFEESYDTMIEDENYKGRLFFPVFTKSKEGTKNHNVHDAVNKVVQGDLDLDRIWKGFGRYETHGSLIGHQFSIGRAKPPEEQDIPTFDWHCEPGSNWYAQISGTKEWYFMHPEYSSVMMPTHDGIGTRNMHSSNIQFINTIRDRLPLESIMLEPGDLLYLPEWEWHSTFRDSGISFAVAMREFNMTNAIRHPHNVGVYVAQNLATSLSFLSK